MPAYVISETTPVDHEAFQAYRARAAETVAPYGGRYLVRGGARETLEGARADDEQVVVIEFPTVERAREWYASPEYAEALAISRTALTRRLTIVEGLAP